MNREYWKLEMERAGVMMALFRRTFRVDSGWDVRERVRSADGRVSYPDYPQPVVSVNGVCDVVIGFDIVNVVAKRKKYDTLGYSFDRFVRYNFECYDSHDETVFICRDGLCISSAREKLGQCADREVYFSFVFDIETESSFFYEFAKLLRREGFYL